MDTIYITGHRNPDTDSIVSALAYAALRNAVGDRQYQAARLGPISDETQIVLDRFGVEPPVLITNLRTQVQDLDFDTPPGLSPAATVSRAWQVMKKDKIRVMPIQNEDGTLYVSDGWSVDKTFTFGAGEIRVGSTLEDPSGTVAAKL